MNPLPDRTVILGLVLAIGLCFALAAWTARLAPPPDLPLQWRSPGALPAPPPSNGGTVL